MDFYIIIPAHNEQDFIALTLESLVNQTLLPKKVVVVNDNSTDNTGLIVSRFTSKYEWISKIDIESSKEHIPGAKIINAFYKGYETLDEDYDVICKFDADLIFPKNYLETLAHHFNFNQKLGMTAGFCYIEKDGEWVLENLTQKDHIRGALKAYRKACFLQIGKLRPSMGWDTVDELLAKYYDWELLTDQSLKVKHLKPTGKTYNPKSKYLQGEAFYKMRYGLTLTFIAAIKSAFKQKNLSYAINTLKGYFKAKSGRMDYLVNKEQGQFIRKYRWNAIAKKLF